MGFCQTRKRSVTEPGNSSYAMNPADCVAIEDSYNGVRSAVAAGIRTIMVPDKLAPNDEMKKIATEICSNLKVVIENCL